MAAQEETTKALTGGMTFGVGEALSIAQFGFDIGQQIFGSQAAEQEIYNQTYNTAYSNFINEAKVQAENAYKKKIYGAKLDYTKQQIENNYLAAEAAWTSEQMRLNDIYGKAAFKSLAMQKMLSEAMGETAAREVYGKSAQRGALVSTLGAYGRSRAQLAAQLMSENAATEFRMKRTEKQMKAQNKLLIAQTSVLPMMSTFSPTPLPVPSAPGIGQTIGGIFGAGLNAFATGYGMTPEGGDFFGIKKEA